ncbi:MAG: YceI family protein [Flavobacteriales bacterium]
MQKKSLYKVAASLAVQALLFAPIYAQSMNVDVSKSSLRWEAGKVIGDPHYGAIQLTQGVLEIRNNEIASGSFTIDMTTISNEDLGAGYGDKLVGHLISDDFFSVSSHPQAQLVVLGGTPFEKGKATVQAQLTIKGHAESIEFEVVQKNGAFDATLNVDRSKFDVRYGSPSFFNDLGDSAIKDVFTLAVHLEVQ